MILHWHFTMIFLNAKSSIVVHPLGFVEIFWFLYVNHHWISHLRRLFKRDKNHRPQQQQQQQLRLSSLATLAEQVKVPLIRTRRHRHINVEVIHVAIRHPEKNGNWEPLPHSLWNLWDRAPEWLLSYWHNMLKFQNFNRYMWAVHVFFKLKQL